MYSAAPPARRVGNWDYIAPEIREKPKLDQLADVFSLGVPLDKLCDQQGRPTFESIIVHATVNNRKQRLQSIKAFRYELNASKDRLARFQFSLWGVVILGHTASASQ